MTRQRSGLIHAPAALLLSLAGLLAPSAAWAQDTPARTALRVCQDPNNLPFSNTRGEGIENRIADVFGKALGLPVTYFSFPNRLAFIRNTLRYKLPGEDFRCDIVMGVPVGFDQVSVTKPYYRSTYALVFAQGRGMDGVKTGDDFLKLDPTKLATLRIGYRASPLRWVTKPRSSRTTFASATALPVASTTRPSTMP